MSLILSGGKVDSRNEVTGTLVGHRYTGLFFCSHWFWIFLLDIASLFFLLLFFFFSILGSLLSGGLGRLFRRTSAKCSSRLQVKYEEYSTGNSRETVQHRTYHLRSVRTIRRFILLFFYYSFFFEFTESCRPLRETIISDPRPMTMSIDTIDTIGFQPHISPLTSFPCSVCLAFPIELHSPSRSLCQDLGL